jgi:dynamin 1-like protein
MAALGEDLLITVNKLQDLVFNTIGSDSLDLPQIVCVFCYTNWSPRALTDRIF